MSTLYPLRLTPSRREKIWGSTDLAPLFGRQERKIGEIWYTFDENTVAAGPLAGRTVGELMRSSGAELMGTAFRPREAHFPILVKFLFTSDKLSVQVHPDDDYAFRQEGGPGKTEMWYVLRAEPGAAVALGLTRRLGPAELRQAALSGEIERYLHWTPVEPGDVVFCVPGTLHSIGAGLALCEIQQNSDLTYRFYDFGRRGDDGQPRPLHIEQAVAVTRLDAHPGPQRPAGDRLVSCPYFAVERVRCAAAELYRPDPARVHVLIALEGSGTLGGQTYQAGDVFLIPASLGPLEWRAGEPSLALRAYVPGE